MMGINGTPGRLSHCPMCFPVVLHQTHAKVMLAEWGHVITVGGKFHEREP